MSILTKICIVVLIVLILLACPVFIRQATVGPNYRTLYEREKDNSKVMEQAARQAQITLDRANILHNRRRQTAQQEIRNLQQRIATLEDQLADRKSELADLSTQLKVAVAELKDLRISHQENVRQREKLQAKLDDARENNDKLTSRNRGLTDTLNEVQANYEGVQKVTKVLREQVVEGERRIAELEEKLADLGKVARREGEAVEGAIVPEGVEISGRITAVRNGLASIDIGTAQGVRRGMELIIHRQGNFVGNLRVAETDVNQAAGVVFDKRLDVVQGDKVTHRLEP